MFTVERHYFAVRREIDDLLAGSEAKAHVKTLCNKGLAIDGDLSGLAERKGKDEIGRVLTQIDWPGPLMLALAAIFLCQTKGGPLLNALRGFAANHTDIDLVCLHCDQQQKLALQGLTLDFLRARDTLVRHNLRLVFHISKRYASNAQYQMELIQEGTFGLIRAAEKYRVQSGYRFSTYAHHWIDSSIRKTRINIDKLMPITNAVNTELYQIYRAIEEERVLGRKASLTRLEEKTGMPSKRIEHLLQHRHYSLSLDDSPAGEDNLTLHQRIADDHSEFVEGIAEGQDIRLLDHVMKGCLSDREIYIINQRFGRYDEKPKTAQWIGDTLGISRERVRQLEIHALAILRATLNNTQNGAELALALQKV